MEFNDTKITRKESIQIVFNILLALAIGALIFTAITIIKKAEEIKMDPIEYAIKNSDIESCTCFNGQGQVHTYGYQNIIIKQEDRFSGEIGDLKLVKEK